VNFATADVGRTAAAPASGMANVRFQIDTNPPVILPPSGGASVTELGEHTLHAAAIDHVTNESRGLTQTMMVTTAPPSTILSIGAPYAPPFVNPVTPFSLSLASGAIVARVEINLDNTGFVTITTGTPFYFPAPGPHSLAFRAIKPDFSPETAETLNLVTDA